jgi:hypothetical protein
VHLVASVAPGVPQAAIPVPLAAWQRTFVLVVVLLGPMAGFELLRRGRGVTGATLFAGTMAASLAFGLYFHFGPPNPDDVHAVAGKGLGRAFRTTATLVAVVDAIGALVGVWLLSNPSENLSRPTQWL